MIANFHLFLLAFNLSRKTLNSRKDTKEFKLLKKLYGLYMDRVQLSHGCGATTRILFTFLKICQPCLVFYSHYIIPRRSSKSIIVIIKTTFICNATTNHQKSLHIHHFPKKQMQQSISFPHRNYG